MTGAAIKCPHCQSEAVVRYGTTSKGTARFRCQQTAQCGRTFLQTYAYAGCLPTVKQQIGAMTRNGSGIRDMVRVLRVGPNTVLKALKKSARPLAGQPQCGGGVLSGRSHSRSATRGSRRGR